MTFLSPKLSVSHFCQELFCFIGHTDTQVETPTGSMRNLVQ